MAICRRCGKYMPADKVKHFIKIVEGNEQLITEQGVIILPRDLMLMSSERGNYESNNK